MRTFWSVALPALVFAFVLSGCSKDSSSSNPVTPSTTTAAIIGKWTVISGDPVRKYMIFRDDNTYFFLNQYGFGLRDITWGIYQASSGTVDLGSNEYPSLFTYTLRNDTLTLSSQGQLVAAYGSAASPADTQWVRVLGIVDSIAAPTSEPTDITINNNTMWYGNAYSSNHLYKIDLTSRAVDSSLAVTVYAWALEWDGTNLWSSSDGFDVIYKLNTATGATTFTSNTIGPWIEGLAWDGTVLWCAASDGDALYRYNPSTDAVLTTIPLGAPPSGLAYAGGYLYVCINGVINKCTTAPFALVTSYRLPAGQVAGIAFDGASFWVTATVYGAPKIYKVSFP